MKTSRFIAAAALLALAGCAASPDNRYYVLTPAPGADSGGAAAPQLSLRLPAYLDRQQIVFIDAAGKADIREFDRWAEPLDGMVKRVLADDMRAQRVAAANRHVFMTVDALSFGDGKATLQAHWTVTAAKADAASGNAGPVNDFAASRPIGGDMTEAVGAMSELLAALARKTAASLR